MVMAKNLMSKEAKNGATVIVILFNIFFIAKIVHEV